MGVEFRHQFSNLASVGQTSGLPVGGVSDPARRNGGLDLRQTGGLPYWIIQNENCWN